MSPLYLRVQSYTTALLLVMLFGMGRVQGAHIIGGEMYYTCLGPGSYAFTMKLYRDCNSTGANFDNPASFGVYSPTGQLVQTLSVNVNSVVFLQTSLDSPCLVVPPNVCVQEGTYVFSVSGLNPGLAYQVVYQRCCRNNTIQNLINPGSQGLTIRAVIPPFNEVGCNSSPSYNSFPPPVLCALEQLNFDHSATDADGDSLAYKLCSPFLGGTQQAPMPVPPGPPPYAPIIWANPYSATAPLNGAPELSIDVNTGWLTGVPTQLGQFVVGVCVEEWRNGVLLSTNVRDFQFNVTFCEPTTQALIDEPSQEQLCQGLYVEFLNLSNPNNNFLWDFGDPNTVFDFSTEYNASYTYPEQGTYTITLITNPGFFCSDTTQITITVGPTQTATIVPQGFACSNGVAQYAFEVVGNFDPLTAEMLWNFGPNATVTSLTGLSVQGVAFNTPGPQPISVQMTNTPCDVSGTATVTVAPLSQIQIDPQNVFCNGLTYQFTHTGTNVNQYLWNFGVPGNDGAVSTQPTPTYTFPAAGVYTVSLTANGAGNCPVTATQTFSIQPLLAPNLTTPPIACFEGHSLSFQAGGSFTPNAAFTWSFQNGSPANASTANPQGITFPAPGTYQVALAITENGCTRTANTQAQLHPDPVAAFETQRRRGCAPLEVIFRNTSITQSTAVLYQWDLGDGNTITGPLATHLYEMPGIYTVSLQMDNLNGCQRSDYTEQVDYIEVLPTPKAAFTSSPERISAVNPVVTLTSLSEGNTGCNWFFDNAMFDGCEIEHLLANVSPQPVRLVVSNEVGCSATAEGMIFVSDHIIFVPNAFTPDGDGLNDLFRPVTTAVASYDMVVLDRWGREVYNEQNVTRGWDGGIRGSGYYAQPGLYQYIIRVTDFQGWNFDYTGTVTLLR